MKPSLQAKIDRIYNLASRSKYTSHINNIRTIPENDGLSEAVRNKKEADQFLADLEAAFKIAGKNNN